MTNSCEPTSLAGVGAVAATAMLAFACVACTIDEPDPEPVPAPDPEPVSFGNYVALGDSYAALGSTASTVEGPEECQRTPTNYPGVLATEDRIESATDATCNGAEVRDLSTSQHDGVPPQFDALTAETDLVTVSIGGNDIGFGGIVECVFESALLGGGDAPCRDRLGEETGAALGELGPSLDDVYSEIAERSPQATVVATRYLRMLPADGSCGFVDRVGEGDREWIRDVTEEINEVVVAAAERAGHDAVLPESDDDRSGCAVPEERWTDFTGVETDSVPMHPTALGQEAMAVAVLRALP